MSNVAATPSMAHILEQHGERGPVFWLSDGVLAVFDAHATQTIDGDNFADLTMLDGFTDALLGRSSEAVDWSQLRSAWALKMRALNDAQGLRRMAGRMEAVFMAEGGTSQDLVWLVERAVIASLIPIVVDGLAPRAHDRVMREILSKIAFVFSDVTPPRSARWQALSMAFRQVVAGAVVHRELAGRARGARPRRQDLADPVVDMLPALGIGRAVDAVTALLTAITGSPGAVAACLLLEISRRPEWRARLEAELRAISPDALYRSPVQAAPTTARFVREILRRWGSPSLLLRDVRVPITYGDFSLRPGQQYVLSPWILHNDPATWAAPDVFDPDRWLAGLQAGKCPHGAFMPFGWAPKSCIGAQLGLAQLILLAHLACTRFDIRVRDDAEPDMIVASVVRPRNFIGTVVAR